MPPAELPDSSDRRSSLADARGSVLSLVFSKKPALVWPFLAIMRHNLALTEQKCGCTWLGSELTITRDTLDELWAMLERFSSCLL
jgi:hypothetical protein